MTWPAVERHFWPCILKEAVKLSIVILGAIKVVKLKNKKGKIKSRKLKLI